MNPTQKKQRNALIAQQLLGKTKKLPARQVQAGSRLSIASQVTKARKPS